MKDLPDDVRRYRRTAEFTEATVPEALTRDHATKAGVWGLIHVLEGRLAYHIEATNETIELTPAGLAGVIEPQARHRVTPLGAVRFYVEFWR